jgi:hypothetical protein
VTTDEGDEYRKYERTKQPPLKPDRTHSGASTGEPKTEWQKETLLVAAGGIEPATERRLCAPDSTPAPRHELALVIRFSVFDVNGAWTDLYAVLSRSLITHGASSVGK